MANGRDAPASTAPQDDRATLLEIARLMTKEKPADAPDSGNGTATENGSAPDHAEEASSVPDTSFDSAAVGLAICVGGEIVRANECFALALGYPDAGALPSAGKMAAIFPDHAARLASTREPDSAAEKLVVTALTRSRRQVRIPVAVHPIASTTGETATLLVLHPDMAPGAELNLPELVRGAAGVAGEPAAGTNGAGNGNAAVPTPCAEPPAVDQVATPDAIEPVAADAAEAVPANDAPAEPGEDAPSELKEDAPAETTKDTPEAQKINGAGPGQQALRQDADFLAKLSHDMRTPLNTIIGFAQIMRDEQHGPLGSERYRGYIKDIIESGEFALNLIRDLLVISKVESGDFELNFTSVDLNELASECVEAVQGEAHKRRVFLRMALAGDLPLVLGDRASLEQMLLNLLRQSIKLSNAGGQVIVDTQLKPSGAVRLRVQDHGSGMSEAEISQAMQPFRQLDALPRMRLGTGLTLPLTKALARANRAKFRLASAPGTGTKITISFPKGRRVAR